MDILAEAATLDPPSPSTILIKRKQLADRKERNRLAVRRSRVRKKLEKQDQPTDKEETTSSDELLGYAVNILDKTVEHTEDWELLCDKYMHLYEKQRAANDEQETQITILNELVDQKGDFIKQLADICQVQRQAPEPVAVRGSVFSSLTSLARERMQRIW